MAVRARGRPTPARRPRGGACPGGCCRDSMSGMARLAWARAAWIVPAICAALLLAAFVWEGRTATGVFADVEVLANVPLSLGFALVGALIVSRRPDNRLGRLYLGSATAMALVLFVYEYAAYGLVTAPGSLPGATAAAWVSSWIWALGFAPLFTLGLLLYPDGRLPSAALALGRRRRRRHHRPAGRHRGADARPVPEPSGGRQPAGPGGRRPGPGDDRVGGVPAGAVRPRCRDRRLGRALAARRAAAASSAGNWCSCSWPRCCASCVIGSPGDGEPPPWLAAASLLVLALVPAAIGLAVVRHRLLRDRRRAQPVAGLRRPHRGDHRALRPAGLGARPAARRRRVGRRGGRRDHRRPRAAVAHRAAAAGRPRHVRRPRGPVRRAVPADRPAAGGRGPRRCPARAGRGDRGLPAAALRPGRDDGRRDGGARRAAGGPLHEMPLDHQGQRVGRLVLEGRDRRPVPARDLLLLTELARPAGAAVCRRGSGRRAAAPSRARLVKAREEERRRLRRDLHDGLGPDPRGVALGLDAGRPPGSTTTRAAREGLLGELQGRDRRRRRRRPPAGRTACGRPPSTSSGLVGALRQQADRLALRSPGLEIRVDAAAGLPPLPRPRPRSRPTGSRSRR